MHSFRFLLTFSLSALSAIVLASEEPLVPVRGFSVSQSPTNSRKTGPGLLHKVYRKFNKPVPEHIKQAVANGQGSVVATPEEGDVEYLSPIKIGGQDFNVTFDTGSADLWVFSDLLSSTQSYGHTLYRPGNSPTSHRLAGSDWKILYGDGTEAEGLVYSDNVNIGGVTVNDQAVEAAQQVSLVLQHDVLSDGIFGLGFSSVNGVKPQPQRTFFENAIAQGVLTQSVFTADLKKGKAGTYNFGYIDPNAFSGPLLYTAVDSSRGLWIMNVTGYAIGDNNTFTILSGIVDTGSTLLMLPDEVVNSYYSQIPGAKFEYRSNGYVIDCAATLPDFTLYVEDHPFTIPGNYINLHSIISQSSKCFGGIQSSDDLPINIFGDVFLKAVFAVFDPSGPQLGFASKSLS